jgi:uncharacterized OsmC-like protein
MPTGHQGQAVKPTKSARMDQAAEQLAALAEKTERYCTVFQTLLQPPPIQTEWQTPSSSGDTSPGSS